MNDLRHLFEEQLGSKDVQLSDFSSNYDGLKRGDQCIRVIPGGQALSMQAQLGDALSKMPVDVFHSYNVCAGAYATTSARICRTSYECNVNGYVHPSSILIRN